MSGSQQGTGHYANYQIFDDRLNLDRLHSCTTR